MFIMYADKTKLIVHKTEPLTSGSVNVYQARFRFSQDWENMTKTACFRSESQTVTVLLDDSGECVIPWEVTVPDAMGRKLYAGVYGSRDGNVVLPTIWADLGIIQPGAACGSSTQPPTPGQYEQVLAELEAKQDRLTGLPGQVVGFDEAGSAVPVTMAPSGSEEEGSPYELGHGLAMQDGKLTIVTADDFTGDTTLPISAAAVEAVIGNIEIILKTI